MILRKYMAERNDNPKFSIRKRIISFKYAIKGMHYLMKTQHNAWIHSIAALTVIVAGFYFSVSRAEWALIVFAIGMVFAAETFNTAIEMLVDKISPEQNEVAGKIKDLAAGAVLFSAIAAAIIGVLIFWPRVFV